jgi:hypothetical protein
MKLDWKKEEKIYYLPKGKPELVDVPEFTYFTIRGKGNPNDPLFAEYISVLYSLSYAIKMSPKQNCAPPGYVEYTVYPLEGVWDLTEEGKNEYGGTLNKNELVFTLMIRQPDFVTEDYCIQMLHVGSYDDEPASFKLMEAYAQGLHLERTGRQHKEIYLSDPGRVEKDKLKTVLRFKVQQLHSTP